MDHFNGSIKNCFSGEKATPSKSMPSLPAENTVKTALSAAPVSEVPGHVPKPPEAAQVPNASDISLSHMTSEDLQTDGLESQFTSTLPRVSMALPGPIPVSGLFKIKMAEIISLL